MNGFLGVLEKILIRSSGMVGCEFAIRATRDLVLISIFQVSKWETNRHEEVKQLYKRMIIIRDHRINGKVRNAVGKKRSETMRSKMK